MAAKDDELRLMETLAFVPGFAGAQGEHLRTVLDTWLAGPGAAGRAALSALMSVGSWYSLGTETERALRKARRALMLAHGYFGADVAALKPGIVNLNYQQARTQFLALFNALPPAPAAGTFIPAASFQFALAGEQAICAAACAEVPGRLVACINALGSVRHSTAERTRFTKFFGPYNERNVALVLGKFHKMHSCKKNLRLYYRGAGITAESREIVPPVADAVRIYDSTDAGYYARSDARDADPLDLHIFIGKGMFGPNVEARGGATRKKTSRAAVLIHEMSHYVCGTNDELCAGGPGGRMYGSALCMARAAAADPLVLTNASSYQWYSDEFS